jgi:hypothetical protein
VGEFVDTGFQRALDALVFPGMYYDPPNRPAIVRMVSLINNRLHDRLIQYVPRRFRNRRLAVGLHPWRAGFAARLQRNFDGCCTAVDEMLDGSSGFFNGVDGITDLVVPACTPEDIQWVTSGGLQDGADA